MRISSTHKRITFLLWCLVLLCSSLPASPIKSLESRVELLAKNIPREFHILDLSQTNVSSAALHNTTYLSGAFGTDKNPKPLESRSPEKNKEDRILRNMASHPFRSIGRLVIRNNEPDGKELRSRCTATLVGPRIVSTAAHCIDPKLPDSVYIFQPGYDNGLRDRQEFAVTKVYREAWTGGSGCEDYQDIAIPVLAKPAGDQLGYPVPQILNRDTELGVKKFSTLGYTSDLYGAMRPVEQNDVEVISVSDCGKSDATDARGALELGHFCRLLTRR